MITAAQCRSARTLLSWSVNKLASAASVSERAIDNFELERRRPDAATISAIRRALEDVGAAFLPGDDVRILRRCLGGPATAGVSAAPARMPVRSIDKPTKLAGGTAVQQQP